mgnify:CR=1 FL=1
MFLGEVMEVKGIKEVKGVKPYVLQLNNYAKKTIVLTPLTSLTSELAKLE